MPIPVGNAVVTTAGRLPFRKIVHTVGPMWVDKSKYQLAKPMELRRAVENSIKLTGIMGYSSVAMPAISSGIFGFPKSLCAKCLIDEAVKYAEDREKYEDYKGKVRLVSDIRFTNFDDETCEHFIRDFDRRMFDSEGRQHYTEERVERMADGMLSKELRVDILEEGEGELIPVGSFVTMYYKGTFLNGEEFDSRYARCEEGGKPFEFLLGSE